MKFEYNTSNEPPAPYLSIVVSNPLVPTDQQTIQAKLDTGADITALPTWLIEKLGLIQAYWLKIEGYGRLIPAYKGMVEILLTPLYLEIIPYDEEYALLGRDALNTLRLLLDGPSQTLEVLE